MAKSRYFIFLKAVLLLVNAFFLLAGVTIAAFGIWLRSNSTLSQFRGDSSLESFQDTLYTSAYVLIGFGCLTFLISACGCCAVLLEKKVLLTVYLTCVTLVMLSEVAVVVASYIKKDDLIALFKNSAHQYIHNSYRDNNSTADLAWNYLMYRFNCCGINGFRDFDNTSAYRNYAKKTVPLVCCRQITAVVTGNQRLDPVDEKLCQAAADISGNAEPSSIFLNSKGCYSRVTDWINNHSSVLLAAAGTAAGFELIVLLASFLFCQKVSMADDFQPFNEIY